MAIVINGSGTITGLSAGGLPDGSVDSDTLATGIDATKLADGTITNSELQYINSLTSNAQTQISAAGGGKVLQVVYSDDDIKISQSTSSTSMTDVLNDASGTFELAITPSATTSDLLIFGHLSTTSSGNVSDVRTHIGVLGKIGAGSYALLHPEDVQGLYVTTGISGLQLSQDTPIHVLWSPSTTSECKIKLQHDVNNASSTSTINSNGIQSSSIIIMELDGS